jgi:hypothetical protein
MFLRVCGRAEKNFGSFRARLGVVRGEDDDEGNFFFLENFNKKRFYAI